MSGRIVRDRKPTIPVIGKIKTGYKNDRGLPVSTDYFIPEGNYAPRFTEAFGDRPQSIEVVFISDDIEQVCCEQYEIRTTKETDGIGGRRFAYGDGVNFFVWVEKLGRHELFTTEGDPDLMAKIKQKAGGEWYVILTMRFLIPRIRGVLGVWQFSTRGDRSSIPQIVGVFDQVRETAGTASMIPFDLQVKKVQSQNPGSKSVYPVVQLIPNVSQTHLEMVRDAIDGGENIRGLLTEENIEQQAILIGHETMEVY